MINGSGALRAILKRLRRKDVLSNHSCFNDKLFLVIICFSSLFSAKPLINSSEGRSFHL